MKYKSIFPALLDIKSDDIPIFIPTFNQPDLLRMTLKQLESYSHGPIIVYDNNSTYQPMIDFLSSIESDVSVVYSSKNTGPRLFTEDEQVLSIMPKNFIVTDPDLIYNKDLPSKYISEMKNIISKFKLAKIGFALDIDSPEEIERFQDAEKVKQFEIAYWQEVIGNTTSNDPIYSAYIDTTFSLNDRDACRYHRKFGKPTFRYPSARIGGRYTCQHVGWWKKDLIPQSKKEQEFYLKNQKWSHTEIYYYR